MHCIAQPHHLHNLLQTLLLLVHDALHQDGHRVDERDDNAERHDVLDHKHEAVEWENKGKQGGYNIAINDKE